MYLFFVVLAKGAPVALGDGHVGVEVVGFLKELLTLFVAAVLHPEDFLGFEGVHGDGADEGDVDSEASGCLLASCP